MTEMGMVVAFNLEVKGKSNTQCFFLLKQYILPKNLLDIITMRYVCYVLRDKLGLCFLCILSHCSIITLR